MRSLLSATVATPSATPIATPLCTYIILKSGCRSFHRHRPLCRAKQVQCKAIANLMRRSSCSGPLSLSFPCFRLCCVFSFPIKDSYCASVTRFPGSAWKGKMRGTREVGYQTSVLREGVEWIGARFGVDHSGTATAQRRLPKHGRCAERARLVAERCCVRTAHSHSTGQAPAGAISRVTAAE